MRMPTTLVCWWQLPQRKRDEAVVTLHSTVSGSQDWPKVIMYLLPWQQPGDADFEYRMQGQLADELFTPVDR